MKKSLLLTVCLLAVFNWAPLLKADILSTSVWIPVRVKIINSDDFINVSIVALETKPQRSKIIQCYVVHTNDCLLKKEKRIDYFIFALPTDFLNKTGLEKLPLAQMVDDFRAKRPIAADSPIQLVSADIIPDVQINDENWNLKAIVDEYKLVDINHSLKLVKVREIKTFKDDSTKIITF